MAKLRAVQERRQNIEVHSDLRNMGGDPLLKGGSPVGALVAACDRFPAELATVAAALGIKLEWDGKTKDKPGTLIAIPETIRDGEHKLHAVHLFLLASHALDHCPAVKRAGLFELQRLHPMMKASTQGHEASLHDMIRDEGRSHIPREAGLHVAGPCSLHLEQAGFTIRANAGAGAHLTVDETRDIVAQAHHEASTAKLSMRKAG